LEYIKESRLHHPQLYITFGTSATKIIQELIKDVPVVFSMVSEPLQNGINVPGVSLDIDPSLKLSKLKNILPGVKRIGIIYSEKTVSVRDKLSGLCSQIDFQLIDRKIGSAKEFIETFKDISKEIDCFMMIADADVYFPKAVDFMLQESLNRKMPVIGLSSIYTKAGALISFDCDYRDIGAQTAEIALAIYTGKKPDTLTLLPRKVSFSLNLKVAEMIGIEFPAEILREASEAFGR
jgi:putative ABC transport system substrate-binding protein